MTPGADAPTSATARELLLVAERLFGEHGIAGVSLRQIALEAGSANNSAVRYHFGSKDGLLRAIFQLRLPDLLQRRALLKARVDPGDLRAVFEAHFLPLFELAESPDCSYVSFIEQIQRSGPLELFTNQPDVLASYDEFVRSMHRLLTHVPEPVRRMRIRQALSLTVHTAAERERAVNSDETRDPFGLFVSAAVDGLTAYLAAPVSPETRKLAQRAQPAASSPPDVPI